MQDFQDPEDFLDMFISTDKGLDSIDHISYLPTEIHMKILYILPLPILVHTVSHINWKFNSLAFAPKLWYLLFKDKFVLITDQADVNWKQEFIQRYTTEKNFRERHVVRYTLSHGQFDLVSSTKDFLAAHSTSDPIACDLIYIWDLRNRKTLTISPDMGSYPTCTYAERSHLYIGTEKGEIHVYNIKTQSKLYVLSPKFTEEDDTKSEVTAITSNGIYVIVGYISGVLAIWQLLPESELRTFHEHHFPIKQIILYGDRILTQGPYALRIWDLKTGAVIHRYNSNITCMVTDHSHVFCGIGSSIIKLNMETGNLEQTITTHSRVSKILVNEKWIFSLEERSVYDPTQRGNIRMYDKLNGTCFSELNWRFPASSLSLYSAWYVVSGHVDGTIFIWDSLGKMVRRIPPEVMRHLLSIQLVESGIILMDCRQLCYLCWVDTLKQRYIDYENQVFFCNFGPHEKKTVPGTVIVEKEVEEHPAKKHRKLLNFWDCK